MSKDKILSVLKSRQKGVEKEFGVKVPAGTQVTSSYGDGEDKPTGIDQYDDIDKRFMKKLANVGIVIQPRGDIDALADKDFALIIEMEKRAHRKFPISDSESTMLSTLYFLENKSNMPTEYVKVAGAKIKEACVKFNIDTPHALDEFAIGCETNRVPVVREKVAQVADEDWGLIMPDGKKLFPMHDEAHLEKAVRSFTKVAHKLTPSQRQTLRTKMAQKVQEFGWSETVLEKKAEAERINPNLVEDIKFRSRHLEPDQQEPYIKLANLVLEKKASVDEGVVLMQKLDRTHNYFPGSMPAEAVFSGNYPTMRVKEASAKDLELFMNIGKEKVASVTDNIQQMFQNNDTNVKLQQRLETQFDKSLVEGLKQDPETVFNSLPRPHQDLIKNIIQEVKGYC